MYDVFISYSRKDTNVANRICKAFDEAGITYFIDRQGIGGAYEFPAVLAEAIMSSKIFLYLASRNSYESKFTQSEITFAFNRKDKGTILPYIIDNSSMPISLEFVFSAINWRNMKEHPIETVLVDDLLRLLGKERTSQQEEVATVAVEEKKEASSSKTKKGNRSKWIVPSACLGVVLLAVCLFVFPRKDIGTISGADTLSNVETVASENSSAEPVIENVVETNVETETVKTESIVNDAVVNEVSASSDSELLITANGVPFSMKYVPLGQFMMGATQNSAYADEKPAHKVSLDKAFYIGETEVTQALWKAVMGNNPSAFKGEQHPVEQISYKDCNNFIVRLNELTGYKFRLPTEAEWEFAAKGGGLGKNTKYCGSDVLDKVAWCTTNSSGHTHDVKGKAANELGIYDMSGNVWEWCSDWYGSYAAHDAVNPKGPASGDYHVYRGGCWCCDASFSRVTIRGYDRANYRSSEVGFRIVLDKE